MHRPGRLRGRRLYIMILLKRCHRFRKNRLNCHHSIAMRYDGGLEEGVWAGDRFRITTMERLPEPLCEGAWKDVTEEVCGELKAIWDADYDEDSESD